ncbi:hypothetical protein KJ713_03460 [Patescibacteria group bacterium]|nr:hypothetical protein [Patescibacteria group bacterium]
MGDGGPEASESQEDIPTETEVTQDSQEPNEAAEISEEVQLQQRALDLAREKGLNVGAVKENIINSAREGALRENKDREMVDMLAQAMLEVTTSAQVTGKNQEIPYPLPFPSFLEGKAIKKLGAKIVDAGVETFLPSLPRTMDEALSYEIPGIGRFVRYATPITEDHPISEQHFFLRGLPGE